ncbi:F-box domain-containing protein [Citrus sinensis]|uniref:F-box domain-containing protein n=1 Tax=Citrus sinensis TaxID=2711 RepID=A0ACB8JXW2_CITSI|nr:F-box domain-containing protein [Citrus sinensis]
MEAEALGIRETLSWLKGLQFPCIILETDCLRVFQALVEQFSGPNGFGLIIDECRALPMSIREVQFSPQTESLSCITDKNSLLHCNKKMKREIVSEDYTCVHDRLSELSDDVLVNVLSCLTIQDAARTSILSSRWRYLWKWFTGCLNFHNSLTTAAHKFELRDDKVFDVERRKFVSWVNQVLRSLQSRTMEELRIRFDVTSDDDIHNWIKFAVEKKVRRLELNFRRFLAGRWEVGQYNFPPHFVSYSSFSSLTELSLINVAITGDILAHLLSYCPLLEHLEIDAPNLISFEFNGPAKPICLGEVCLAEVSFGGSFSNYIMKNLCWLSSFLVRLHTLKLNLASPVIPAVAVYYNLPELYNLKHLEMEIDLLDDDHLLPCASFLNAATSLYKFTLKLYDVKPFAEWVQTIKDHVYSSLSELISIRELEVVGLEGCGADTDFVICLIENAELLEKIIIDPCKTRILGTPYESSYRECAEYQSNRRQAIQLAARLPLWEFVIL